MVTFINMIVYHFSTEIIGIYTSIPVIQKEALSVIGLFIFHIPPDLMKKVLQGTINAMGI